MKNIILILFLLFVLSHTYTQYPFGGWTTVYIETNLLPNSIDKPAGGNLTGNWKPILIEEFIPNNNYSNGINEKKWNFGEYGDDGLCSPKGTSTPDPRNMKAVENPDISGDGLLRMDVISQKHDSCLQSKGGMGAELMTFSVKEDFQSYWLYPNTYMELRVKQTFGYTVGVGVFLYPAWGPYLTEIDFCETLIDPLKNSDSNTWAGNSNGKQDEYSSGYIWGESYNHPNFSCQNKVQIKDKKGKPVEMEGEWLIWGLEWHENVIRYYLNNVLQREMDLTVAPSCQRSHDIMYYKPQPMSFRFTHSNVTSEKNSIPDSVTKSLFVDYIRVYQPADSQVIQGIYIPKKICDAGNGGGDNISVRYYPDVIYEWSSPAYDFEKKDMAYLSHCFCEMQWMHTKPELGWGIYPVYLKATLPDGRIENYTWQVEFGYDAPLKPSYIQVEPVQNSGYYKLLVESDSNTLAYIWSLDSIEWKETLVNTWQPFSGSQTLPVWVKTRTACGWSDAYKQIIDIPNAPKSVVFCEEIPFTNPIAGEKTIQEITVYDMMGNLIRRRLVIEKDTWEGVLAGLISGIYIVLYRDRSGKIVSLNKVYVSP